MVVKAESLVSGQHEKRKCLPSSTRLPVAGTKADGVEEITKKP